MIARWSSWILAGLVAGILIGSADAAALVLRGSEMFFDAAEAARTAGLVFISAVGLAAAAGLAFGLPIEVAAAWARRRGLHRDAGFIIAALTPLFSAALAQLFWMLTSGPSVRELTSRPFIVLVAAALGAMVAAAWAAWAVLYAAANRKRGFVVFAVGVALAALSCAIDAQVLVRLYEPFHVALSAIAVMAIMLSFRVWAGPLSTRWVAAGVAGCGLVAVIFAGAALVTLSGSLNPRFVVKEKTLLARHLLLSSRSKTNETNAAARGIAHQKSPEAQAYAGPIDLVRPGADLLLITVDAMRFDRLTEEITPNIEALARKSIVFDWAYTPYPHTSHAISSLLTGKYTHALLSVPGAPRVHETWPEILRDFRYRTAAFYTNAVFFIDRALFEPYKQKGYGFSHRDVAYKLSAAQRTDRVISYLETHEEDQSPVFAWVHYFDAHEPYDEECTLFGTGDEQRYNCELHEVDRAVGRLLDGLGQRLEETIVIVTADHGEEFGDHGGRYHGTTLYDEQARVPLIVHVPNLEHRVVDTPVGLVDLLGTSLHLLDIPVPARLRSRDLRPLMLGHDVDLAAFSQLGDEFMVASGDHKLICDEAESLCRLYDLVADPKERRSVAKTSPEIVSDMRAKMDRFARSHAAFELRPIETASGTQGWPEAILEALAGDKTAIPKLVDLALSDDNAVVRKKAAELLYDLGASSSQLSKIDLDAAGDPQTQAWLALARLAAGDTYALGALEAALPRSKDDVRLVRSASVERLRAGDVRALEDALQTALDKDAPTPLRIRAAELVGQHARPRVGCRLMPLIDDYQLTLTTAEALAKSRCKKAKDLLVQRFHRERFPERKEAISKALADLGVRVR